MGWIHVDIKLGTIHGIYQKLENLCRKRMFMLTSLQVSSLAGKCVFYGPEQLKGWRTTWNMELKDLETKKWNIPTDRAQIVDEKN